MSIFSVGPLSSEASRADISPMRCGPCTASRSSVKLRIGGQETRVEIRAIDRHRQFARPFAREHGIVGLEMAAPGGVAGAGRREPARDLKWLSPESASIASRR